jgi:hypothetical protein
LHVATVEHEPHTAKARHARIEHRDVGVDAARRRKVLGPAKYEAPGRGARPLLHELRKLWVVHERRTVVVTQGDHLHDPAFRIRNRNGRPPKHAFAC